ncbi:hypothetical protein [Mycobacterium sp. NPDC006124]|uniref:hypothetical protein n=1 Tax=Mycobacterium sp. NPDC006124 TaxID=3156729 RepID=UPI0033AB4EE1
MTFVDRVKRTAARLARHAKDEHNARQEKSESDITPDPGVAGARANTDGNDGSYVGRTNPQFDAEVQQSGAEARSEAARNGEGGS